MPVPRAATLCTPAGIQPYSSLCWQPTQKYVVSCERNYAILLLQVFLSGGCHTRLFHCRGFSSWQHRIKLTHSTACTLHAMTAPGAQISPALLPQEQAAGESMANESCRVLATRPHHHCRDHAISPSVLPWLVLLGRENRQRRGPRRTAHRGPLVHWRYQMVLPNRTTHLQVRYVPGHNV